MADKRRLDPRLDKVGLGGLFQERLNEVIAALGGVEEAAERVRVSRNTLWKWRKGQAKPPLFNIAEMCALSGHSLDWLVGFLPGALQAGADTEMVLLPRYEVRAGAGPGLVPVGEGIVETFAFRLDWLSRLGLGQRSAGLVSAQGDSMSPTIPDQALMLVDLSETEIHTGHIYIFVRAGELQVKRAQRVAEGVELISDNPAYRRELVTQADIDAAGFHVAGRVVWVAHPI